MRRAENGERGPNGRPGGLCAAKETDFGLLRGSKMISAESGRERHTKSVDAKNEMMMYVIYEIFENRKLQ